MKKALGSWSGMRKYLEKEMLADCLRGRVRYNCTRYVGMDDCHIFEIFVDGKLVRQFSWETVNSWFLRQGMTEIQDPYGIREYWAEFWPRAGDPHADNYDFVATALIAYWYDEGGNLLSTSSVTENPAEDVTVDHAECYSFQYNGTIPKPEAAISCKFQINVKDRASGKEYTATTDILTIE